MNAEYKGACHCGAIGFTFRTGIPLESWQVRACQCSFCTAHGGLSVSDPEGRIAFDTGAPGDVIRYRFGLRTADFLICAHCGVYIGARIDTSDGAFGILNARALKPFPDALPEPGPVDYDGEDVAGRGERRIRRWTPCTDPATGG